MYGVSIDKKRFKKEDDSITLSPFSCYSTFLIRRKSTASNFTSGQDTFDLGSSVLYEIHISNKKQRNCNKEA